MKIFFEVSFGTQWVLVSGLFRPVIVFGRSKLNGISIYTCIPAGRRFFFDLHPQGTFSDHLSELDDFPQKLMFLKIEQKILLRATKNLKIFSAWSLGPQVHPTVLVWDCHLLIDIYGGPYVENGRFLSFQNSAGVLVQP